MRSCRILVTLLLAGLAQLSAKAQLTPTDMMADSICINEIMVGNYDQFVDPSWNYGAWVELFNRSGQEMDFKGCWVSDDPDSLMKYHITEPHVLPPHGFLNLWFDHHDKYCPSQLRMSFDEDGGTFYLCDPYGHLILQADYPPAILRCSYARRTDGDNEWGYTGTPTPAATNGEQTLCSEQLAPPEVSHESCVFPQRLTITVTIPEGCTLRYTKDGSTPTKTHGTITRVGRFNLTETTVMRFRLFCDGMLPSDVVTRTYVNEAFDIPIPIVSIATNSTNLYSSELGIFTRGTNGRAGLGETTPCNWNMDWDRPLNFEFITAEGKGVINQEVTVKRNGAYSRRYTPYGFKVKAEKLLGDNRLRYQFFPHKPHLRHKQMVFRSAGNDYNSRLRDPAVQHIALLSGLNLDIQGYEPVVHFINGLYRGTINMREPNNKNYVFANYGYDEEEIDFFEMDGDSGYVQMAGDRTAWERLYTLAKTASNADSYREICTLLDIDEFCNYMAVEFYLGNDDWPKNNFKCWRPRAENGRFRVITYDIDHAFNLTDVFKSFANKKNWTWNPLYNEFSEPIPRITGEVEIVTIFLNLLKNAEFCRHFIDAFCIVAGSVYDPNRAEAILRELCTRVEDIQLQPDNGYGRNVSPWNTGNTLIERFHGRHAEMYPVLEASKAFGLAGVTPQDVSLSANTEGARLFVNDQIVPTGKLIGRLYPPIHLRAEAPAGYRFSQWKLVGGKVTGTQQTLIAPRSEWSYYDKGSLDATATWNTSAYNDSRWSKGNGPLGYAKDNTQFSTILDYGGDTSNRRTTFYFRHHLTLDEEPTADDVFQLGFSVDDGAIVYVNGTEAFRTNMPTGTVKYATFSSGASSNNPDQGTTTLNPTLFKRGDNVIAVEVHNNNKTSSDIYWDASLTLRRTVNTGTTMLGDTPELDLPEGAEMELQALFVRDEQAAATLPPVVINEVAASGSMFVNEHFKKEDWVELFNTTDEDIDLEGYYLSDDIDQPTKCCITSGEQQVSTILPAHGYRIVWCDKSPAVSELHASFKLANADQAYVVLTSPDRLWADTLIYCAHDGTESFGRFPDGTRQTYRFSRPTIEKWNTMTMLSERWQGEPVTGTGGDGISETMASRDGGLSIQPRSSALLIHSEEAQTATLSVYTLGGSMVMHTDVPMLDGRGEVNISLLARGTYVARITDSTGHSVATKFSRN